MNGSFHKIARRTVQGILALVCLFSATTVKAQAPKAAPPARPAAAMTPRTGTTERSGAEQPEPNDGAHQGVKVHGHWAIEVKNPDGSIAKHVEFENSLVKDGFGDLLLAFALTGRMAATEWALQLNASGTEPVLCSATNSVYCTGVLSPSSLLGQEFCAGTSAPTCTTGTMAIPSSKSNSFGILITGTIKPLMAGNITSVQTVLAGCTDSLLEAGFSIPGQTSFSPQTCATANIHTLNLSSQFIFNTFTSTSSFAPIPVVAGQIVAITVTITFS